MSDVPLVLRIWAAFVAAGGIACGVAAFVGVVPGGDPSETVPMSVRDNPSSYRPSYGYYSGWHPPSSTGGGGFGFGK